MTIDERLEFIATLQQTHGKQIGKMIEQGDRQPARLDVLTERTIQAMDAINRLVRLVENHEERIEDFENGHPS